MLTKPPIILASGSPRRRELLAGLGLDFTVQVSPVDEKDLDVSSLSVKEQVCALATYKGQAVAQLSPEALVISADTIVVLDDRVLGKPESEAEAVAMLLALQGRQHTVYSAISVFYQGKSTCEAWATLVRMRPLTEAQCWQYVQTGEPMDKAGSYAIQGIGSTLIERIEGCYFNVVGMSLTLLDKLTAQLGVSLIWQA